MNAIGWFEIPVSDIERASKFYNTLLGISVEKTEFQGTKMAIFPHDKSTVISGALVQAEGYVPGQQGPLIYFNAGEDLTGPLNKVEGAGGKVLLPKTSIGPHGFCAHILDTEGNKVALHSMN